MISDCIHTGGICNEVVLDRHKCYMITVVVEDNIKPNYYSGPMRSKS